MDIEKVSSSTYRLTDRSSRINVGLIVTSDGALIVDTGSTVDSGQTVARLVADVTSQPIAYVVNTHHHLEHTGGNGAFSSPVLSHVSCYHEMLRAKKRLTEAELATTKITLPQICFSDKGYVMLGSTFVEFVPVPGHTEGSIAVHIPEEGVVFGGDALSVDTIPIEAESDLPRWLDSVRRVRCLDPQHIIPGRQEVYSAEGLDELESNLERIVGGQSPEDSRFDAATGLLRFDPPRAQDEAATVEPRPGRRQASR